jgi:hypothetical protein
MSGFAVILGTTILTLSIVSEVTAEYLTGSDRDDFIKGAVASCMRGKVSQPTLNRLPDILVLHYCECYSEGIAQTLPITEIRKEKSAAVDAAVEREATRCFDAMKSEALQMQKSGKLPKR